MSGTLQTTDYNRILAIIMHSCLKCIQWITIKNIVFVQDVEYIETMQTQSNIDDTKWLVFIWSNWLTK